MNTEKLSTLDHEHLWHPFTPMKQWREKEPLIIESGDGCWLTDTNGKRYLDGVSSLWCNIHGHTHPKINAAITEQLNKVSHTTLLGLSSPPAIELAAELSRVTPKRLNKVFYSDAGATATEVAFKMAIGYWYHKGQPERTKIIALEGAYHGDTTGAMSVGYDATFHQPFESLIFETHFTPAPDLAHDPRWRHAQQQMDERHRVWSTEDPHLNESFKNTALSDLEDLLSAMNGEVAAVVIEPLVQGAAGLILQPEGYLKGVRKLCDFYDVLLICDEVATGFGRTGKLFACEHEGVEPDILCMAKGLSGGYLPLAATIASDNIAAAFEGEIHEHKTLYHGHTFTGNPLACAAALASLKIFEEEAVLLQVEKKIEFIVDQLEPLRDAHHFPMVFDVRQKGMMIGIELALKGQTGKGFDPSRRLGYAICDALREKGIILRPLGNVVVMMPPLSINEDEMTLMCQTLLEEIKALQIKMM